MEATHASPYDLFQPSILWYPALKKGAHPLAAMEHQTLVEAPASSLVETIDSEQTLYLAMALWQNHSLRLSSS